MEIRGDDKFRRQARQAIALLEPLPQFALIQTHLRAIRQGRCSGVTAWAEQPVFTVGTATWSHSPEWFAGAIAHDAYHAKLYRTAKTNAPAKRPAIQAWSGATAEQACLIFQRSVLLRLSVDKSIVEHVEIHLRHPTYQGRSGGLGAWLDYRKRWW